MPVTPCAPPLPYGQPNVPDTAALPKQRSQKSFGGDLLPAQKAPNTPIRQSRSLLRLGLLLIWTLWNASSCSTRARPCDVDVDPKVCLGHLTGCHMQGVSVQRQPRKQH